MEQAGVLGWHGWSLPTDDEFGEVVKLLLRQVIPRLLTTVDLPHAHAERVPGIDINDDETPTR